MHAKRKFYTNDDDDDEEEKANEPKIPAANKEENQAYARLQKIRSIIESHFEQEIEYKNYELEQIDEVL
jgi:hypothetical protein